MKQKIFLMALLSALGAEAAVVKSPDGRLALSIDAPGGIPTYSISYDGKTILADSPLGFVSDVGDFSSGMTMGQVETDSVHRQFTQDKIKKHSIDWRATRLRAPFTNSAGGQMTVEMEIADNDVALRYLIPRQGETAAMVIKHETTGFHFPESSTAFITPQADAMTGWKRTKPSYEEYYVTDAPLDSASQYGNGYTFPALFRIGNDGWALLSETGVDGYFCGSHLSDYTDGGYSIAYAMPGENNGNGSASPGVALPCATPWRTITVGSDLAPIVETVVPWAVVEPRYTLDRPAMAGRGSWSWLLWQDNSINFDDQVKFIDLAAEMGYENVLIDNFWDKNIGRERMPELFAYARAKGINPILWYSSSGHWNDITQSPTHHIDRPIVRKAEMKWLRDNGIRAIKVDFFGGDKQETMRLYEDILSDAADYGIDVVFHGCTLPRGWERMYPNMVGAEAVLASENLVFEQKFCDLEAFHATLHPFIRNSVAIMEYGGSVLNRHMSRDNLSGNIRRTGDGFQLATAILFQNPVQNFALAPNNLTDAPAAAIEFMKYVPTTWDDTRYISGYPGRHAVIARRHGKQWYVAGVNAGKAALRLDLDLSSLGIAPQTATIYLDRKELAKEQLRIKNTAKVPVEIAPEGGFVIVCE